jgi:type II secretory ATPase GspE/PulE/Tfp pilus assembly ATPase PilB-like protein
VYNIISKHKTVPLGMQKGSTKLYWAVKEPDHIQTGAKPGIENTVNIQNLLYELVTISQSLGAQQISIVVMPTPGFKGRVADFCQLNNMSVPPTVGSTWKPSPANYAYNLIIRGIINKASDIYFWGTDYGLEFGYSILCDYVRGTAIPMTRADLLIFRGEIYKMASVQGDSIQEERVRDYSINNLGKLKKFRGRLNMLPNDYMDAINIRVIEEDLKEIPFRKELLIRQSVKDDIEQQLMNPYGIWLISGATGSGKTTTLHSCLGLLRDIRPTDRIEVVEKPIEQLLDGICQIGLREDSNVTEMDVARALTRRNAQILNVGEINTGELVRFAVNSALQQLLVISTIHSYNVAAIPDRIKGFCIGDPAAFEQFLLVVKGLVHQTMLKEVCPNCKEVVNIDDSEYVTNDMKQVLAYYGYKEPTIIISKPKENCPLCHGLGKILTKPVVCVESFTITNAVRRQILRADRNELQQTIKQLLIKQGKTGVNDALQYLREGRLDWLQIWHKYSLANEVGEWLSEDKPKESKGR